jgi:Protein of unknown function (DUF664)
MTIRTRPAVIVMEQPQSRSAHALASRMSNLSLIGEYAGHTGQADLIRERIDGKAGWW